MLLIAEVMLPPLFMPPKGETMWPEGVLPNPVGVAGTEGGWARVLAAHGRAGGRAGAGGAIIFRQDLSMWAGFRLGQHVSHVHNGTAGGECRAGT